MRPGLEIDAELSHSRNCQALCLMNISTQTSLSRCRLLRGAGAVLGLPVLEAMHPVGFARAGSAPPPRLAFFYIPNGVVEDTWQPAETGSGYAMPRSLASLESLRDEVNVFTGLDREFRGGSGVHAQAACSWLTSSPPREALDGGFPTNITLDQVAAETLGSDVLLPSLELSTNNHANARETKHFETISWLGPGYSTTPEKETEVAGPNGATS